MNKKKKSRNEIHEANYLPSLILRIVFVMLVMGLLIGIIWNDTIDTGDTTISTEDWDVQSVDHGVKATYTIAEDMDSETYFAFGSTQQEVWVFVNEELVYSYEVDFASYWGSTAPSAWHMLEISDLHQGDVVSIRLESTLSAYEEKFTGVIIGRESEITTYLAKNAFVGVLFSVLTLCAGIMLISVGVSMNRYYNSRKNIYSGSIFTLVGIWGFNRTKSYNVHFIPLQIERQLALLSVFLIAIFMLAYLYEISREDEKESNTIYKVLLQTSVVAIVIVAFLQLTGVFDLIEMVIIGYIQLVVVMGIWVNMRYRIYKRNRSIEEMFRYYSCIVVAVAVVLQIITIVTGDNESTWFHVQALVALYLISIYVVQVGRSEKEIEQGKEAKEQAKVMKENLLIGKMKPHFLYNTLLAIQELCYSDPIQASDAIGVLSKYMRESMDAIGDDGLVTFYKELAHINSYVNIQQICYEDQIEYEEDIVGGEVLIPPLTVQPIVENAIRHGIRKKRGKGTVTLRTYWDANDFVIVVTDNGVGFDVNDPIQQDGTHSGDIVKNRLEELVGATMLTESVIGKGTIVTIRIPQAKQQRMDAETKMDLEI